MDNLRVVRGSGEPQEHGFFGRSRHHLKIVNPDGTEACTCCTQVLMADPMTIRESIIEAIRRLREDGING